MPTSPASQDQPFFSVLIGRVGTEDGARILETLRSLRQQAGFDSYEIIVADRLGDATTREIARRFPEVRMVPCPPDTTLPALRTTALERARGRYVLVTEDHCIAPADWMSNFAAALREAPPGTVAVGGSVGNGVADTGLDRATFLCEYSAFLDPVREGQTTMLPGMNVAYDRAVLAQFDCRNLAQGFWESTVHPLLADRGGLLVSTNRVRIVHAKRFRAGFFARQRFLYSRFYAGTRFASTQRLHRTLACVASTVLPALLLARIVRNVLGKPSRLRELLSALPWLVLFTAVWAAGEMVGYAAGPGDALRRIE